MADRSERIETVFAAALVLEPSERDPYIERELGGDEDAAEEVRSLLGARDRSPEFLSRPLVATAAPGWVVPERLGPWKLVREIGAGGMGSVWLAERDDGAYAARAAIKLVHPGLLAGAHRQDVLRRFADERQTLADLDHPHIARLLDGGAAPDGSPYLVLELVEGVPLDRFCDDEGLDLRARLRLFVQICDAVQYAHGKLVAHRDLKPGNVLVRRAAGGEPEPKLLDFGIARLFGGLDESTRHTTIGSARLTPAYASPEQMRGEPVTAASDVYSLGVIFFELLTGALPHDLAGALPVVARRVCEEPARRARSIDARIHADLDTIAAKALEKEPGRRYATAAALAEDLERHLAGYPIRAKPATRGERFVKAVRRDPLPFALAAGAFVAVTALSAWLYVLYQRALTAEKVAQSERVHAERTSTVLEDLLRAPRPFERAGRDVRVIDVLDETGPKAVAGLEDDPAIRVRVGSLLGDTYAALGAWREAETYLRASAGDARALFGATDARTLERELRLSQVEVSLGSAEQAVTRLRGAWEAARAERGDDDETVLHLRERFASALRETNHPVEAEEHIRGVFEGCVRRFGEAHNRSVEALATYAAMLSDQGRWAECDELALRGLALEERLVPRVPSLRFALLLSHGNALRSAGRGEAAAEVYSALLAERRAHLGDDHPHVADTEEFLAEALIDLGRYDEAEALALHARDVLLRATSTVHHEIAFTSVLLADIASGRRRADEAEAYIEDALRLSWEHLGDGHWVTQAALARFWMPAEAAGNVPLAAERTALNVAVLRRELGPDHRNTLVGQMNLSVMLFRLARYSEAESLLRDLAERFEASGRADTPEWVNVQYNLALAVEEQGRVAEAEAITCELAERSRGFLGEENYYYVQALALDGRLLARLGRDPEAESVMRASVEAFRNILPPSHPRLAQALRGMVAYYEQRGRQDEARPLRDEVASIEHAQSERRR